MTNRIGNISIGSIASISIGKSVNLEEYDVLDEDDNSIVVAEDEAYKLQIDFIVTPFDIIDQVTIDEQKERIARIPSRDSAFNAFSYLNFVLGFISVSEVTFNDSSDRKNIIEGTINGVFLPWPRFFSQLSNPSQNINNYGSGFYGSGIYPGTPTVIYNDGFYGDGVYN